jgi:hypothetical protein
MTSRKDDVAWLTERLLASLRHSSDLIRLIEKDDLEHRTGWQRARTVIDSVATAVEQQQSRSSEPAWES